MDEARRFETQVLRDVQEGGLLGPGDRVVVAVSGGADSTALLAVLRALGADHGLGLDLHVAHFDHGLRGEGGRRDAAHVESVATRWGLPFHGARTDALGADEGNLEARARDLRAAFLARVARETSSRAIALGHTLDDQAETVLHRLARGGGVRALAGMAASRPDGVVRPLLRRRRDECRGYLAHVGVGFVEDPTNADLRFTRNRIRHDLLPVLTETLGVDLSDRIARMADELRVEADLADRHVDGLLGGEGRALPVPTLAPGGGIARRIVHAWLVRQGARPTHRHVDAIVRIARGSNPSASVDLPGGRVRRVYDRLVHEWAPVVRAPEVAGSVAWPAPGEVSLQSGWRLRASAARPGAGSSVRAERGEVVLDAGRLAPELVVRTMRPGDRIRLSAGRRKLSDVFTDRKIPRIERSRLAVVTSGADIVWVPGVAVAADVLPGVDTERWMRLRAEPVDCRVSASVLENQGFRVRFG